MFISKHQNKRKTSMKTMKNVLGISLSTVVVVFLVFLASCSEKEGFDLSLGDSKNIQNEAAFEAYQEDADDMGQLAVASDNASSTGARGGTKPSDSRFTCAEVTVTFADDNVPAGVGTVANPHGYITINFGTTGCTDGKGNVRKGIIKVEFKGRRFMPQSFIKITFENYTINGVKIEGTRTVTNTSTSSESNPKFNIVVVGGKATWPDGTFATREANLTREWLRAANPSQDQWTLTGSASGSNRDGKTYQMQITKALVYKRECAMSNKVFMAVEGTKVLTTENRQVTIDYGTGTCDKLITITINGVSVEVEVNGAGA